MNNQDNIPVPDVSHPIVLGIEKNNLAEAQDKDFKMEL